MTLTMSPSLAFTASPLADVLHRGPGLGRCEGLAALEELDADEVGRAHERHPAVARRARDRVAEVDQALAGGVDVGDLVGDVAEVAAARVRVGLVPVVGQLDLRRVAVGLFAEEDEREAALLAVPAADLAQAQAIAEEADGGE